MEQNTPTGPQEREKSGKLWLIILILVILVGIVLFAMSNTTKAPDANTVGAIQENTQATASVQEVDNTASIEQQLKNIDLGNVSNDMKPVNDGVNSVQ